ncbi:hypothetical protein ACFQVA_37150 [Actinomadura keratinilytica]
MRTASDAAEAAALLRTVPATGRVALVDASFVGHLHALRLGLTDPRFPAGAVPGAVTVQDASRAALTRALEAEAGRRPRRRRGAHRHRAARPAGWRPSGRGRRRPPARARRPRRPGPARPAGAQRGPPGRRRRR